ncbi:hypothetical protein P4571_13105 [Niallia alba]|uniref:hypothetical protein n=1 Tax=Niallia alba TaxID=2729105 RepID=UPI002E1B7BC7|nr:hypothetical protein [Niallia alba]
MKNYKKISREEANSFVSDNHTPTYSDRDEKITVLKSMESPEILSEVQQLILAKYYYISQEYQEIIFPSQNVQVNLDEYLCLFNKGRYFYKNNQKTTILLWSPKQQSIDAFKKSILENTISPLIHSFYKKQVLDITIEDPDKMIAINTEPEQIEEPITEKKSFSFYLLDNMKANLPKEDHIDLVEFLQTYYPKSFSIPFPTSVELDNEIVNNYGIKLFSSIYNHITIIVDDKDGNIECVLFNN